MRLSLNTVKRRLTPDIEKDCGNPYGCGGCCSTYFDEIEVHATKAKIMITADTLIEELRVAVKMFGTYSLCDKGLREVFEPRKTLQQFKEMTPEEVGEIMKAIIADEVLGEVWEPIVSGFISDLDGQPEQWFTALLDYDPAWNRIY